MREAYLHVHRESEASENSLRLVCFGLLRFASVCLIHVFIMFDHFAYFVG